MADILVHAIHRLGFLRTPEKLLLSEIVCEEERFSRLKLREIMQIIGRRIYTRDFNPRELLAQARGEIDFMVRRNISYIHYWDREYPPQLREIYDPPFGLFCRGEIPDYEKPFAGVVGTRRPTGTALQGAYSIGLELGSAGIAVVSGLARGIDGAAHRGNLKGGGRTVAVLGSGIDRIYPKENRGLAEEILLSGGMLISEYALGTAPLKFHFPERNRIISGLSRTVVIVQAPERSGALITADFALEQGRELVVYREGARGHAGRGGANLIAAGAPPIGGAGDILEEWGEHSPLRDNTPGGPQEPAGIMMARLLERELSGELAQAYGGYYEKGGVS